MLTIDDLLTLQRMPRESDISLELFQQFYKLYLCDQIFIFELEDGKEIKLQFEEDNLCHLLGIHHILKHRRYKGQSGYELIVDGTVTIQFLKQQNKIGYQSKKHRLLYFPFVYQMILTPLLVEYSGTGMQSSMDFELIIYNSVDRKYLHLGLRKDRDSDFYYPVSFFEDSRDRYVSGQKLISVHHVRIDRDVTISQT
ncbi:MAG: PBECR4 domain-containing protein [Tumebacillaceae bacterium]